MVSPPSFKNTPYFSLDCTVPPQATLLISKVKSFHGELESHLYSYLNPQSAEISTKLIYAIPASIIIKCLSSHHITTLSVIGSAYLWSCREDWISKKNKIDILNAIAIGFFANIFNQSTELSIQSLTKAAFNTTLLGVTLLIINQIEKTFTLKTRLPQ